MENGPFYIGMDSCQPYTEGSWTNIIDGFPSHVNLYYNRIIYKYVHI